jgi:serine phosphatase RsbU (regulator of sigma subunit)
VHAVNEALDEHKTGRTEVFQAEFRFKANDGSWRWIQSKGRVTAIVKAIQLQVTDEALLTKGEISPARILSFFNVKLKYLLKQEDKNALSNAGFDGGVLYFNKKDKIIRFAGAETPLFLIQNHEIKIIKGNRHFIGYKKSDAYYKFTDHTIDVDKETFLYLTTDGFLDQNGGKKGFPFGKKQFKQLLSDHYQKSFSEQKKIYLEAINKYQGSEEKNDDMTFVGLKIR